MTNMTDQETAAHLRRYASTAHGAFSWPTDACGYDQHVRFVHHRNVHWHGGTLEEWRRFILAYADQLSPQTGDKLGTRFLVQATRRPDGRLHYETVETTDELEAKRAAAALIRQGYRGVEVRRVS